MQKIAQIIPPIPTLNFYDYLIPSGILVKKGVLVKIPLGRRTEIGIVANIVDSSDFDFKKLKAIDTHKIYLSFDENYIDFLLAVSNYTLIPAYDLVKSLLRYHDPDIPPQKTFYKYDKSKSILTRLSPQAKELLKAFEENSIISRENLMEIASASVIKGLCDKNILEKISQRQTHSYQKPNIDFLTPSFGKDQEQALIDIRSFVQEKDFIPFLLDGITGSGKTEVFLEIAGDYFQKDKQVLILLPEIGLTSQTVKRFEKRFGVTPALWHSALSEKEKAFIYHGVLEGTIACVIGARSGLFLPFKNLGLIIVDEEHDNSYKQEEGGRYNARDMAVLRAKYYKIPIILASATPSLETYVNSEMGRYEKIILRERFGGAILPEIHLINMQNNAPSRGNWISEPLKNAIMKTAEQKEQSLLFINRRGYAPLMLCRGCGYRIECPFCSAWMVYHHHKTHLKCHQCGETSGVPTQCKSCGATDKFIPCGPGVERLYEEVRNLFPHLSAEILSSDYFDNPEALNNLLTRIYQGEVHILIGTQMIAKGHDFPNLTLVGIIDADIGLGGGDLRASERSFQLLEQVSGRSGRKAGKEGVVYIQTYNPNHPVMQSIKNRDRDEFLDNEAHTRLEVGHPPFGKLAALIISSENHESLQEFTKLMAQKQPYVEDISVFGPAPAAIAMLRKRYRYRFLLKAPKKISLQNFIKAWISEIKIPSHIRLNIDIDPISFL